VLLFLLNRLGSMVLTMLVISILVFFVAEVVPIDPARNALGRYASQKKVDELREKMGLDRPVVVRYVDWISKAVRGDFGESIHFRRPVADLIATHSPRLHAAIRAWHYLAPALAVVGAWSVAASVGLVWLSGGRRRRLEQFATEVLPGLQP